VPHTRSGHQLAAKGMGPLTMPERRADDLVQHKERASHCGERSGVGWPVAAALALGRTWVCIMSR
jgi:hypothetical protein